MKYFLILLVLLSAGFQAQSQSWNAVGTGTNGFIINTVQLDSVTHDIYLGGSFTLAGGDSARYIAQWNGGAFLPIGFPDNPVRCLEVIDGALWAGGDFNFLDSATSKCIARWNGTEWEGIGSGFVKTGQHTAVTSVYAITKYGNDIYAGGVFDYADSIQALFVARWNGTQWQPLGTGLAGTAWVYDMEVFNGELVVCGSFSNAGGLTGTANIAKWNGSSWSSLGGSANGPVYTLTSHEGQLIAGGGFTTIGGVPATKIAAWNGFSWSPVGSGMDADVNSVCSMDGLLYAGGIFNTAGGNAASRIAQWDGINWSALGSGTSGLVFDMEPDTAWHRLYVSGTFATAGGNTVNKIAYWATATGRENGSMDQLPLLAFPNPAQDVLHLRLEREVRGLHLRLLDAAGRIHLEQTCNSAQETSLSLSGLAPGYYLLEAESADSRAVLPVVIR